MSRSRTPSAAALDYEKAELYRRAKAHGYSRKQVRDLAHRRAAERLANGERRAPRAAAADRATEAGRWLRDLAAGEG